MEDYILITKKEISISICVLGEKISEHTRRIKAVEKIVSLNGEIIYKEFQKHPWSKLTKNTSVLIAELENHLLLREESQPGKKSQSNSRNFVQRTKLFWCQLLFKVFNFERTGLG